MKMEKSRPILDPQGFVLKSNGAPKEVILAYNDIARFRNVSEHEVSQEKRRRKQEAIKALAILKIYYKESYTEYIPGAVLESLREDR